jgi:probable phosphoglycerate mutase
MPDLLLFRHGETPWSTAGRHTGWSELPLTEAGRRQASALGRRLAGRSFGLVLVSPLVRARETCELAGYGAVALVDPDLREWNYGDYEGLTAAEIRAAHPGWTVWRDGAPGGETLEEVAARADRVIARATAAGGDVALFAHGHLLRILATRWLGVEPTAAARLALDTASVSHLLLDQEARLIRRWNDVSHLGDGRLVP